MDSEDKCSHPSKLSDELSPMNFNWPRDVFLRIHYGVRSDVSSLERRQSEGSATGDTCFCLYDQGTEACMAKREVL